MFSVHFSGELLEVVFKPKLVKNTLFQKYYVTWGEGEGVFTDTTVGHDPDVPLPFEEQSWKRFFKHSERSVSSFECSLGRLINTNSDRISVSRMLCTAFSAF